MSNLINPHQPPRDRLTEDGRVLKYRTRPKWGKVMLAIHTHANQICMMKLYRAVRAGEVPVQVSINDLYNWLSEDDLFSKKNLGTVVVNSVIYEPRLLLNNSIVGKPTMTYVFGDLRELEYGLEWMICIWLRRFLNETGVDEPVSGQAAMAEELDFLALASEEEFRESYLNALEEWQFPYVDWKQLSNLDGWDFSEELPKAEPIYRQTPEERTPPRDLSKTGARPHD